MTFERLVYQARERVRYTAGRDLVMLFGPQIRQRPGEFKFDREATNRLAALVAKRRTWELLIRKAMPDGDTYYKGDRQFLKLITDQGQTWTTAVDYYDLVDPEAQAAKLRGYVKSRVAA